MTECHVEINQGGEKNCGESNIPPTIFRKKRTAKKYKQAGLLCTFCT